MISGVGLEIDTVYAVAGYYAAYSGYFLPTFGTTYRSHLQKSTVHDGTGMLFRKFGKNCNCTLRNITDVTYVSNCSAEKIVQHTGLMCVLFISNHL